jgi:hypothetical protein
VSLITALAHAYRGVAPDRILDRLRKLAAELRGLRILHLNAAPSGEGVSGRGVEAR